MHGDYATGLLLLFLYCSGVVLVLLGLTGGLGGWLFGHGFWTGAGCGAALAVLLSAGVLLWFWWRFL